MATFYPIGWAWHAPLVGLAWVVGRILYMRGYMRDPEKRPVGAMMGGICGMLMLILAVSGLSIRWRFVIG